MRVLIAGAGRAGLAVALHLREAGHSVAIIDRDLQDGQGEALVRAVRARAGGSCFIVGVGTGARSLGRPMLEAGADIYLQKPIVLPDLLLSIDLVTQEPENATSAA